MNNGTINAIYILHATRANDNNSLVGSVSSNNAVVIKQTQPLSDSKHITILYGILSNLVVFIFSNQ